MKNFIVDYPKARSILTWFKIIIKIIVLIIVIITMFLLSNHFTVITIFAVGATVGVSIFIINYIFEIIFDYFTIGIKINHINKILNKRQIILHGGEFENPANLIYDTKSVQKIRHFSSQIKLKLNIVYHFWTSEISITSINEINGKHKSILKNNYVYLRIDKGFITILFGYRNVSRKLSPESLSFDLEADDVDENKEKIDEINQVVKNDEEKKKIGFWQRRKIKKEMKREIKEEPQNYDQPKNYYGYGKLIVDSENYDVHSFTFVSDVESAFTYGIL